MKDRLAPPWTAIRLPLLLFFFFSVPSAAFELSLRIDPATPDLKRSLANASLVLTAKREGVTNPQDILAAVQADYGRLVSALYEHGYYGPVVSILVDGREASAIPPLSRPTGVSRVDVIVSTGPLFRLGTAEIAPLAVATMLPMTFRVGLPAETSVIRDVALAGVDG